MPRTYVGVGGIIWVVAAVSVILAVLGWIYSAETARNRDERRESDIKMIKNALEIYKRANGFYPICHAEENVSGCLSRTLPGPHTIPSVPTDPLNSASPCGGEKPFIYCYKSDEYGRSYELKYNLEKNGGR